jgi:hypothetical protein
MLAAMIRPALIFAFAGFALLPACDGGSQPLPATDAAAPDSSGGPSPTAPGPSPFSDTCMFTGSTGRQLRSWGSSGADLEGPELGEGSLVTASLRKQIPVRVLEADANFTVGPAYLTRDSLNSIRADFIAEVRFTGSGTACFVKAVDLAWLGSDGTPVQVDGGTQLETAFADGTVGLAGGRVATSTCLTSGEVGYLIDIRLSRPSSALLFDGTASAQLRIDPTWTPGGPPQAAMFATSYVGCQGGNLLEVALESKGPQAALFEIDLLGRYLLFDEAGGPLTWGFLHARRGLGSYAAGKIMVGGDTLHYDGTSRRMQVRTDFDIGALSAAPVPRDARSATLDLLQADQQHFAARRLARWQAARDAR